MKIMVPLDADCTALTGDFRHIDMVMTAKHICNFVDLLFEDTEDCNWSKNNREEFDNFFSEPYHRIVIQKFGDPNVI
jgi:hypothetical protein